MTPPQKPEWIELAEKKTSSFPRTVSRGLPVIALVVSTSILGVGAIFAHSAEESPVKAVEFSTPAELATSDISFAPTAPSTTPSIENPSIGTMPTGRGDDDDDSGFEEEGEDDEDDSGFEEEGEDEDEDEDDESDDD